MQKLEKKGQAVLGAEDDKLSCWLEHGNILYSVQWMYIACTTVAAAAAAPAVHKHERKLHSDSDSETPCHAMLCHAMQHKSLCLLI